RASEVVLATGAIERPIVFPGNDKPGILLASAARTYLNRYAVRLGKEIAVYATHDSGYETALELQHGCGGVRVIIDPRPEAHALASAAHDAGIEVLQGHAVLGTVGRLRVRAIRVQPVSSDSAGSVAVIPCDTLLMAGGWTPTVHLFSQARGTLEWNDHIEAFIPAKPAQRTWVAGACRGLQSLEEAAADGARAGHEAARAAAGEPTTRSIASLPAPGRSRLAIPALDAIALRGKSFVDFQNDVCASDIEQAVAEGFRAVEHLKRYTTTGMATDQGKTSNINAMQISSRIQGRTPAEIGLTTFRAPYTP